MRGLVIHHWDTDGVVSAAIVMKNTGIAENITGPIPDFNLDSRAWSLIASADKVFIVDFNIPHEAEKITKPTVFIDHHLQGRIQNPLVRQINPTLEGKRALGASLVVSEYFNDWSFWSAMGAVGDEGKNALNDERVPTLLKRQGFTIDEAILLAKLLDSNYKVLNRTAVEEAVHRILQHWDEPRALLSVSEWQKQLDKIQRAIDRTLEKEPEFWGDLPALKFKSPYMIASTIARVLTQKYGKAFVINTDMQGWVTAYLRFKESNPVIPKVISAWRRMGCRAGGKATVAACQSRTVNPRRVIEAVRGVLFAQNP